MALWLLPTAAHADVPICNFTPDACAGGAACTSYRVILNTHHGDDAPLMRHMGEDPVPMMEIPRQEDGDPMTYVTLGQPHRDVITLFNGFDALHTRHSQDGDTRVAVSSTGGCGSL